MTENEIIDATVFVCGNCHEALRVEPEIATDQCLDGEGLILCVCGAPCDGEIIPTEFTT